MLEGLSENLNEAVCRQARHRRMAAAARPVADAAAGLAGLDLDRAGPDRDRGGADVPVSGVGPAAAGQCAGRHDRRGGGRHHRHVGRHRAHRGHSGCADPETAVRQILDGRGAGRTGRFANPQPLGLAGERRPEPCRAICPTGWLDAAGINITYNAVGPNDEPLRVAASLKTLPGRDAPIVFLAGIDRSNIDADTRQFATLAWVTLGLLGAGLLIAVVPAGPHRTATAVRSAKRDFRRPQGQGGADRADLSGRDFAPGRAGQPAAGSQSGRGGASADPCRQPGPRAEDTAVGHAGRGRERSDAPGRDRATTVRGDEGSGRSPPAPRPRRRPRPRGWANAPPCPRCWTRWRSCWSGCSSPRTSRSTGAPPTPWGSWASGRTCRKSWAI